MCSHAFVVLLFVPVSVWKSTTLSCLSLSSFSYLCLFGIPLYYNDFPDAHVFACVAEYIFATMGVPFFVRFFLDQSFVPFLYVYVFEFPLHYHDFPGRSSLFHYFVVTFVVNANVLV